MHTVHHTHAAAQVIMAVRWEIPTLVIVRPPLESALAHMARRNIAARPTLVSWIRFHRRIVPYRYGFVAVSFADMTRDFGAVTERVNEAFGTTWRPRATERPPSSPRSSSATGARWGDEMTPERARALARPTAERAGSSSACGRSSRSTTWPDCARQADDLYRTLVGEAAAVV